MRGRNSFSITAIIIAVVFVAIIGAAIFTQRASIGRGIKNLNSEMSGGLERTVEVYDYSGDLLKTYEGKVDVQTTETGNKVLFDLDGKRYVFYNAIVIIEEK